MGNALISNFLTDPVLRSQGQMMIEVEISSNPKSKGSLLFQPSKTNVKKFGLETSQPYLERPHCFFKAVIGLIKRYAPYCC